MIFIIGILTGVALVYFARWVNDGIESQKPLEERLDELITLRGNIDCIIEDIRDHIRWDSYKTDEE